MYKSLKVIKVGKADESIIYFKRRAGTEPKHYHRTARYYFVLRMMAHRLVEQGSAQGEFGKNSFEVWTWDNH